MRFTVPQFIEHEAKIIGPLTLKQFAYVGSAGIISFILYYSVPFHFFLMGAFILGFAAFALAFLKINGRSLPNVLVNFLQFSSSQKAYLWQKKETEIEFFKKSKPFQENAEEEEELPIKITKKSRLKKLKIEIDTK